MTTNRTCTGITETGERCRQRPLRGGSLCFWHDPEHAEEAEQARRLGGQRRRREKITEGAYDLEGIESPAEIRRVLEIAIIDALGLENSVPRSRVLISGALAAARLHEVGELEERLAAIEAALGPRLVKDTRRR
jgi:hypothetical protein